MIDAPATGAILLRMPIRIKGLPEPAVALFERLSAAPLESVESMKKSVIAYVATFDPTSSRGRVVDPIEAMQISRACVRMLEQTGDEAPEEVRRLVQAACRYFVLEDDAKNDGEAGGLEDDAAVVSAVARHLGFDYLAIRV
jgi:hypothetical protein